MRLLLANISDVWHRIESVAEPLLDFDGTSAQQVRLECEDGKSLCFASLDGVAIVKLLPYHEAPGEFELFIWLAVSTGPHGAFEAYLPEIEQVARDLGAKHMSFRSPRPGWTKKLPDKWRIREIEYECDV